MPFGLDLKSIVVGLLLAWFVLPLVMGFLHRPGSATRSTTA